MDPVTEIFAAFDGKPSKLAQATGLPIQTVCDWRRKGTPNIPKWRRAVVLTAMQRAGVRVSETALHYLTSDQTAPPVSTPTNAGCAA